MAGGYGDVVGFVDVVSCPSVGNGPARGCRERLRRRPMVGVTAWDQIVARAERGRVILRTSEAKTHLGPRAGTPGTARLLLLLVLVEVVMGVVGVMGEQAVGRVMQHTALRRPRARARACSARVVPEAEGPTTDARSGSGSGGGRERGGAGGWHRHRSSRP